VCGRFAFYSAHQAVRDLFGVAGAPEVAPHWNIAPTQYVPVVRTDASGARRLAMLYWGLVPSWAKEKSLGARMINARAETLADKPSFRTALRRRRCLVLANGYYEWQKREGAKQPYYIRLASDEPFGMAGLWESWIEREGEPPLESCTIVTTAADPSIAPIHDRMPVVMRPEHHGAWLDPRVQDPAVLAPLLVPRPGSAFALVPVSRRVNNARNDGPELLEPEEGK
jgi:putative SOS response-associated peptidase YedK